VIGERFNRTISTRSGDGVARSLGVANSGWATDLYHIALAGAAIAMVTGAVSPNEAMLTVGVGTALLLALGSVPARRS